MTAGFRARAWASASPKSLTSADRRQELDEVSTHQRQIRAAEINIHGLFVLGFCSAGRLARALFRRELPRALVTIYAARLARDLASRNRRFFSYLERLDATPPWRLSSASRRLRPCRSSKPLPG